MNENKARFSKRLLSGFSKKHPACADEPSERNKISKNCFRSTFSHFDWKLNWFWPKFFSGVHKTAIIVSGAKFSVYLIFILFLFNNLSGWTKTSQFFLKKAADFLELHLRVQRYNVSTIMSSWWKFFSVRLFVLRAKKPKYRQWKLERS